MKYRCPCCGYYTFDEKPNGSYDICEVCFWEDDPIQFDDETYEGGANHVSLLQAKCNFVEYGACERTMLSYVRKPNKDELSGID
ncbi:CPCC family cysteine-rich protein [Anaeromicropila herbilytica]|uniref:Membrane protein n=1 Tax=Anaeromicropila herbilytica TaxID=2785025 RepID=A0A7R7IC56_9FIRM|nr:CPCC family cysteine-rich protein [Anaeromicropila herbilytica]BCN29554.1 membrane protein [Anaeromicropila herbilytica]